MSQNTRNIRNTCLLLRNHPKFTKTEAAFDKCSTKLGVLQNIIRQSIDHVLLIKKPLNNIFERVFLTKNDSCTRFLTTSVEQLSSNHDG